MTTHGAAAKAARLHRLLRPELYCPHAHPPCLRRTGGGYCFRHDPDPGISDARMAEIHEHANAMADARSVTGRRPAQAAFRARLAHSIVSPGELASPWKYEPILLTDPVTGETRPLLQAYDGGAA